MTYCTFLNWPRNPYAIQLIKGSLAYDLLSRTDLIGQKLVYLYWHSLMGWHQRNLHSVLRNNEQRGTKRIVGEKRM
jgi:hypothetical protein